MQDIDEVRQEEDKRLIWRANIGGKIKEWEAKITRQVPDERIAWKSTDGSANPGTILFCALDPGRTKITAMIEYEPEGLLRTTYF
jgi:Predicted integral membrane protein